MYRMIVALVVALALSSGCGDGDSPGEASNTEAVSFVSNKAVDVSDQIGGETGYGGMLMDGYSDHAPDRMGFHSQMDLASDSRPMMVRLRNEYSENCTFHLSYISTPNGLDEHMMDVGVNAGEETLTEIPCTEIVGLGPLGVPGEIGCHLENGDAVDNTMAVPGFLGFDYPCGGEYECVLTADVNDLDGDGDTEELILHSMTMEFHMMSGGPGGHSHGGDRGMMGSHTR